MQIRLTRTANESRTGYMKIVRVPSTVHAVPRLHHRVLAVATSAKGRPPEGRRRPGFRRSCRTSKPHLDLIAQGTKIDWFGQQCFSAAVQGFLPGVGIAVSGYHDDGNVWSRNPRLGQQLKAAHSRHVDVG